MAGASLKSAIEMPRAGLAALGSAAIATGLALLAAMPQAAGAAGPTLDPATATLIAALAAGAATGGLLAWRLWRERTQLQAQLASSQKQLATSQHELELAVLAGPAADEALLYWDASGEPQMSRSSLDARYGVPTGPVALMWAGGWLEPASAQQFRAATGRLTAEGKPFAFSATTLAGGVLEVSGQVRGSHAVLRVADQSVQRKAVKDLEERTARIARDAQITRALFEALNVPVWFRSADGRIDWVNSAYVRAVDGFSREDVRTRQVELLESRQRTALAASLGAGKIHRERVHVFVGGERRSYDLIGVPMDGASAIIANDAAALETAQDELTRQMAANDRTLERVSTAVANFGPDQRLVYCNEAYRQLWKLDPQWLASKPKDGEILDRLRERRQLPEEADYRKWKTAVLESYSSTQGKEAWWYLPGARTLHVTIEQRPDGGVTYLFDEVTEKLALESRYNAAMRMQRGTLDTLREGVAVFATDGRLSLFNPSFARLWKLNPNDLAREPHIDEVVRRCAVLFTDDTAWGAVKRAVTSIDGQRQRLQGTMQRPDHSVIAYAGLPLPDGAVMLTFVDITDTARAAHMLQERNEALVQADRLKSQFISLVSYELRSPLQNIIGFSEFLESPRVGPLNPKQREYLQDIHGSSRTLLAIINDILDLTTIDAGALELKVGPVKTASVVQQAAAVAEDRLNQARLEIRTQIDPAAAEFMGDEHRVKQVLYNLISNAIGFSKDGGAITVDCRREGGDVVFSVTDQGMGIPPEEQARVFDRFVSRAQGSRHRGAGLGLPIVKHLVELHGGSVSLSSELGKGTRVTARFPADPKAQPRSKAAA